MKEAVLRWPLECWRMTGGGEMDKALNTMCSLFCTTIVKLVHESVR
jgi:hypothetical protein